MQDRPRRIGDVVRPDEAAAPDAAILSDFVDRPDDQRLGPDPLLDRRQLAGRDQLRELRRLVVLGRNDIGEDGHAFELADERLLLGRGALAEKTAAKANANSLGLITSSLGSRSCLSLDGNLVAPADGLLPVRGRRADGITSHQRPTDRQ